MIDFVLYPVFGTLLGIMTFKLHNHSKKLDVSADKWDESLTAFMRDNNINDIDLHFMGKVDIELKKKLNNIEFIAKEFDKGYDFIYCKWKKGYKFPPHNHHNSTELFYVVNGKIKLNFCNLSPDNCKVCAGNCSLKRNYYENTEMHDDIFEYEVKKGDFIFVDSGKVHTVEALNKSEFIIVSRPSMVKDF